MCHVLEAGGNLAVVLDNLSSRIFVCIHVRNCVVVLMYGSVGLDNVIDICWFSTGLWPRK